MENRFNLTKDEMDLAKSIHDEAIIVDGLSCLYDVPSMTALEKHLDTLLNIGVTAVNNTVVDTSDDMLTTIKLISAWYDYADKLCDKMLIVDKYEDIEKAKKEGKIAIIFGMQNSLCIGDNIKQLKALKKLGFRIIQLTYQQQNFVGSGCAESKQNGLSGFGIEVVKELNELGILIDLSHCGNLTTEEAIQLSKTSVAITHSNAIALNNHVRAKTDKHIKMLSERDGVIGIAAFSPIIQSKYGHKPSIEDFLDSIEYVINLIGDKNIGFGLDLCPFYSKNTYEFRKAIYPELFIYNWEDLWLEGLDKAELIPNITQGLVSRGYSKDCIKKILGGNFLRVFKSVWK